MEGYAKLASLMGAYPEVAILRRFGALNVQNLLYLQAELVALESDLKQFAAEGEDQANRARDWYTLSQSRQAAGEEWQTMKKIRKKLKEYSVYQLFITRQRFRSHTCG